MNKLETAKNVIKVVVSIGVGAVVGNAIKATSPSDMKAISKLTVALGGMVLANIASDKAAEYTDAKIDETVDQVKEAIAEAEEEVTEES